MQPAFLRDVDQCVTGARCFLLCGLDECFLDLRYEEVTQVSSLWEDEAAFWQCCLEPGDVAFVQEEVVLVVEEDDFGIREEVWSELVQFVDIFQAFHGNIIVLGQSSFLSIRQEDFFDIAQIGHSERIFFEGFDVVEPQMFLEKFLLI